MGQERGGLDEPGTAYRETAVILVDTVCPGVGPRGRRWNPAQNRAAGHYGLGVMDLQVRVQVVADQFHRLIHPEPHKSPNVL